MVNPIAASDLTPLGTVSADNRHELGVAASVCERRNHRDLRNVSKAYDAVSDRPLGCRHVVSSASECVRSDMVPPYAFTSEVRSVNCEIRASSKTDAGALSDRQCLCNDWRHVEHDALQLGEMGKRMVIRSLPGGHGATAVRT